VSPPTTVYVHVRVVEVVTAGQVAFRSVVPVSRVSVADADVVTASDMVTVMTTDAPVVFDPLAEDATEKTVGAV
jgi:hypothetical protein